MSRLHALKNAATKSDLAFILGVKHQFLTYTLYGRDISSQYYQFQIMKKSGGYRTISAPTPELKELQSRLSKLLLDCIAEINDEQKIESTLSHGFSRGKSIVTNAVMHEKNKNVLNIDLSEFFCCFNFGRVRGFFIKNDNFQLNENIATVIAKIACFNNELPQGSPCSPVISNLITHPLDIRLARLAKKYSCTYSRYADDLTFSTRKNLFDSSIVSVDKNEITIGKKLEREIIKSGFTINDKKTRVQFKDSRQDVTGLIVNHKVNIKSEYWRSVRAMCHELFMTGDFYEVDSSGKTLGNINKLDGMLNFIDSVDRFNNQREKGPDEEGRRFVQKNHGLNYRAKLNSREKTFSKFLYYKNFYGNKRPTIICEGKTDVIYMKSAIKMLCKEYPKLAEEKNKKEPYKVLVNFFECNKRTRYLLDLYGGASYLKKFAERYANNHALYKAPMPESPVIILADNDSGPVDLLNYLCKANIEHPVTIKTPQDIRQEEFIYISNNLYLVLTPLCNGKSCSEDFFDKNAKNYLVSGKKFDPAIDGDTKTTYGKNTFANKVIKANINDIDFSGFKPILSRINAVIEHYEKISMV